MQDSSRLLSYTKNESLASLYERRGISVAFGGVDEFFLELEKQEPEVRQAYSDPTNIISTEPVVAAVTTDVDHEAATGKANFARMFSGSAASYADIRSNFTFDNSQ